MGNYPSSDDSNYVSNVVGSGSYTSSMGIYDSFYDQSDPRYYVYTGSFHIDSATDFEFTPMKNHNYIINAAILK